MPSLTYAKQIAGLGLSLMLILGAFNYGNSIPGQAIEVTIIKFDDLQKIMQEDTDEIRIINFWATWCAPCIKEMPYFEALPATWAGRKLKVYLVSMDVPEEANGKVARFIERRGIKNEVLLLDETDFNAFIDKVDPTWSGAIPATIIQGPNRTPRKFVEKELHEGELEALLKDLFS